MNKKEYKEIAKYLAEMILAGIDATNGSSAKTKSTKSVKSTTNEDVVAGKFAREGFKRKIKVQIALDNAELGGDANEIAAAKVAFAKYMKNIARKDLLRLKAIEVEKGSADEVELANEIEKVTSELNGYEATIANKGIATVETTPATATVETTPATTATVETTPATTATVETTPATTPGPAPTSTPGPAPTSTPGPAPTPICPLGAPAGYKMAFGYHYNDYVNNKWTDQDMLDSGAMVKL